MTKDEILNKAKYILFESYANDGTQTLEDIKWNRSSVLDYLKDKCYLKIGSEDINNRYINDIFNSHHYTTKFFYENLQSIMNFIGVADFNFNDFVVRHNILGDNDYSYLYYIKPIKYKITTHNYNLGENALITYYVGGDIIECDYTFFTKCNFNHILGIYTNKHRLSRYHELNYMAHDCGIIENLSTSSNKVLLISCDSHSIPLIPILSCYYKKIICLDSRFNGNNTRPYYEKENIDDVLICMSFNANITKYINKNFT